MAPRRHAGLDPMTRGTSTAIGFGAVLLWASLAVLTAASGTMPPPAHTPAAAEPAPEPGHVVKSPMVGTFYRSSSPGAKAFVEVGSEVKEGEPICIIEAMKIMNEIESEVAGVVTEVLASDAQPVEYGQPLFRIDPNG